MLTKFRNRNGSLSAYAFACGYIERTERAGVTLDLYRDGCWHVRAAKSSERLFWDCYDSLSDARKAYAKARDVLAKAGVQS